jgi:hypothetical protein
MDRTRRSLCGLGIASVPLAVIAPKLLPAAQDPAEEPDPMLAYLVAETMRNCRAAARPGRGRGRYVRALGANVETLSAYLHSRPRALELGARIKQRVRDEGADVLAARARDKWPRLASELARDYGVTPPADLDNDALAIGLHNLESRGLPNFRAVRRYLDREADAIEFSEGRAAAVTPARQTPGNDYGPPGWNAGIGDPNELSCYDLGVFMGALALLELIGELAQMVKPILAILAFAFAIACNPIST